MRSTFFAIIIVLGGSAATPLFADSADQVVFTSKVKTMYLGGNGAVFYDGPVLQSDLYLGWDSGFFVDVWTSTAANTRRNFDKEIDFIIGYNGQIGDMKFAVDVGYFVLVISDVVNLNVDLNPIGPLFLRAELYAPVHSGGPKSGFVPAMGLRNRFSLSPLTTLVIEEWLEYDSGAFGFEKGLFAQGYVGLDVTMTESISLTGGMTWSAPLKSINDGRKNELSVQVGLVYEFK